MTRNRWCSVAVDWHRLYRLKPRRMTQLVPRGSGLDRSLTFAVGACDEAAESAPRYVSFRSEVGGAVKIRIYQVVFHAYSRSRCCVLWKGATYLAGWAVNWPVAVAASETTQCRNWARTTGSPNTWPHRKILVDLGTVAGVKSAYCRFPLTYSASNADFRVQL